jgi:predicted ATP-grasp superfamily ATP-dependent carboligase
MADAAAHPLPAILLASDKTGVGALRSLRMAGIDTYVACPPGDLVTHSRWFKPTPGPIPWDGTVGPDALRILREMPVERAALIPGADDAALWLSGIPNSELAGRFRVSTSSRESLEILQDKSRFKEFLMRERIPHPRTFSIARDEDVDAIPFAELDRVFIKPTNSQKFSQVVGAKGIWVKTREQFLREWRLLDAQGFRVMAQEYVPGTAADHYFVDGFRDRTGALTGLFARRRLRIYPPDFGNSSYCESIALADVEPAVASIGEILSKLSYRGIFSAEFKRDSRNGEFKILEVNTRAWWYVEFAARCGVNVCRMAYEDALDMPVEPSRRDYPIGIGCVNMVGDMKTALAPEMGGWGALPKAIGQWSRAYWHVFRLDDPMPGLTVFWSRLRQAISKRVRPKRRKQSA